MADSLSDLLTYILSDLQIDIPTGWGTDYLKKDLGDLNGARGALKVLINRLTHRLVGSRNNWLTDLLSDLQTDWLIEELFDRLTHRLILWLTGFLIVCLTPTNYLSVRLPYIVWLTDWLSK